jgi:hypothetical protein
MTRGDPASPNRLRCPSSATIAFVSKLPLRTGVTLAVALLAAVLASTHTTTTSATAPGGRTGVSQYKGFDTCTAPSDAAMNAWATNSPYWDVGIYISRVPGRGVSNWSTG